MISIVVLCFRIALHMISIVAQCLGITLFMISILVKCIRYDKNSCTMQ